MKTIDTFFSRIFLLLILLTGALPLAAQDEAFFTVSGLVRDQNSRRPLANVTVSVPHSPVGTITNADGTFVLKIRHALHAETIEFSHLGYLRHLLPVAGKDVANVVIALSESQQVLGDVVVYNEDPMALVEQAIRRIGNNYRNNTSMLTGFYRETVQKRQQYINIAEAVMEVYSAPYTNTSRGDRAQILKGRSLVSTKAADTLAVKLQGGPNTYIFGDIMKNPELVFDLRNLHYYRYQMENPVMINEKPHYVVSFYPAVTIQDEVLFVGQLYIDRATLTVSRAEYGLDMSNPHKVTQAILRSKPGSLRFNPDDMNYVAQYRERDGRSYLYYVRNSIRFRCDWRRRLFRTNYTVIAEMVITDSSEDNAVLIPVREMFRQNESLSDRVNDFYDPNFWEAYNIIEPTESLESAVDRLRKQRE